MALAAGIGLDHARIDRESFAANQLLIDTALRNLLKHVPKGL
jgi:hypothetical protein